MIAERVELFDVLFDGADLLRGDKAHELACRVDLAVGRSVAARDALVVVQTLAIPERATLEGRSWPVRLVWMRLARPGHLARLLHVIVSSAPVARSGRNASVTVGAD